MKSSYTTPWDTILTGIYNSFGGYHAFMSSWSTDISSMIIEPHEKAINTTVRALAYLHFGTDNLNNPEYGLSPSLNRATEMLKNLKEERGLKLYKNKFVTRTVLHKRWTETGQTLCLIYAASSIKVNKKSLLQIMYSGDFSFFVHGRYLKKWIERARFVCDHIFARMDNKKLYQVSSELLTGIKPSAFSVEILEEDEKEIAKKLFRKKIRK